MKKESPLKGKLVFWACLFAFIVGFRLWWISEKIREETKSPKQFYAPPPQTRWSADEILTPNQIRNPFAKEIVTQLVSGDTFVLSSGQKMRLMGIVIEPGEWEKEAVKLAKRLVENREIFIEFEPGYKKQAGEEYGYLYFRIPIIPSQPPVGPEYVHWSLNAELLKLGYAKVNESVLFKYIDKFRAYEKEAKSQHRGLWK